MHRTTHILVVTLFVVAAIFMFGPGCSHDSSLSPTQGLAQSAIDGSVGPTFCESFANHTNTGNWSYFDDPRNPYEVFDPKDGNPDEFLHTWWCRSKGGLVGHVPRLRTQAGVSSVFTGDFRARGVTRVGLDLAFFPDFPLQVDDRPLCLTLSNDMGTPADTTDDIVVLWLGTRGIPPNNGVWMEYDFSIDSESPTLPKGWMVFPGFGSGDDNADWNTVITNVSQISYTLGDPRDKWIYDFQLWDVGLDNARIWYEN